MKLIKRLRNHRVVSPVNYYIVAALLVITVFASAVLSYFDMLIGGIKLGIIAIAGLLMCQLGLLFMMSLIDSLLRVYVEEGDYYDNDLR